MPDRGVPGQIGLQMYSIANQSVVWQQVGPTSVAYGWAMLGNVVVVGVGVDGAARQRFIELRHGARQVLPHP